MSTAIITGASRGFGRALSAGLASHGWTVIAAGRNRDRLDATRGMDPSHILAVRGDIRDLDHQQALVEAAARNGGLDLLVHNASALGPSPLPNIDELAPADLSRVLAVNVIAPLTLTQLALPLLDASATPTIVGLSSDAAVEAYPGWGAYGSSKAAVDQLLSVLAVERPALAVYGFDPGDMRTDMHQRAFPGEDISDRPEPATVVPALLGLLDERPASGRYRAADLTAGARK
jgi:NAD(P)-dependent dehydrogenase (short-subunit alcohol dehydrogenase family)